MTLNVLLCTREGEDFFGLLDDLEDVSIRRVEPDQVPQYAAECEVFYGPPSPELLSIAPKLKWIQSAAAGVEFVARIPALAQSDVILTNTRGAHGPSIGEHTMALLLSLTRHIPESMEQMHRKHWERGSLYKTAREVGGLTMGIIGFGALGRGIAQRALAFDMNLLAVDAQAVSGQPYLEEVWPVSRLDDLMEQSDVVVVAAPLTAETHHLIDAGRIAKMKKDAYLIVVSRGGIVVEEALIAALKENRLAGAALDVTEKEPLPIDDPLWDAPHFLLTPHLAGASAPKERRVVEIFRENILRYQKGEPMLNVIDKSRGY